MRSIVLGLGLFVSTFAYGAETWSLNPNNSKEISRWFQELRQPDKPHVSCCGEADAFEADDFEIQDGVYMAIITNGQGVIPNGTPVRIPIEKFYDEFKHNPTGHGIVFLHVINSSDDEDPKDIGKIIVFCYLEPEGA
jgi:hypothetical protein